MSQYSRLKRAIRKNQAISPFGLGAIYDLQGESFVHCKTSEWLEDDTIRLKRLELSLNVTHFRLPPVPKNEFNAQDNQKVIFKRFPAWHFCNKCRRMVSLRINDEKEGKAPLCSHCNKKLVPMRFVTVCENGHLDDVDWWWWVHAGTRENNCRARDKLKFISKKNRGTGLAALFIECSACNTSPKSLEGLTHKNKLMQIRSECRGANPWERDAEECNAPPQVVQRGGSNVYFPKVVSALDIPSLDPGKDKASIHDNIRINRRFRDLQDQYEGVDTGGDFRKEAVCEFLINSICKEEQCKADDVIAVLTSSGEPETADEEPNPEQIFQDEWTALTTGVQETSDFKNEEIYTGEKLTNDDDLTQSCFKLISRLSVITRMREVRALIAFERLKTTGENVISLKENQAKDWLPALEVFGEGIFFTLNEKELKKWEEANKNFLAPRIAQARTSWTVNSLRTFLPKPDARFILLHTLSHLLMKQITFECGYSSASLRERIYSSKVGSESIKMAGILIYTADSDSEGALGGLVDQGRIDRFIPNLLSALTGSEWCSNDPVCSEIEGQGLAGLNRAACHACALTTETSCVYGNALLDRTLLLGLKSPSAKAKFTGYFEEILKRVRES